MPLTQQLSPETWSPQSSPKIWSQQSRLRSGELSGVLCCSKVLQNNRKHTTKAARHRIRVPSKMPMEPFQWDLWADSGSANEGEYDGSRRGYAVRGRINQFQKKREIYNPVNHPSEKKTFPDTLLGQKNRGSREGVLYLGGNLRPLLLTVLFL